jgi:hypothetical protein
MFETILGAVAPSLIGGLLGGDEPQQQQTGTRAPWEPFQPYLTGQDPNIMGLWPEASQIYRTNQGQGYRNLVAPVDEATRLGYGIGLRNAQNLGMGGENFLNASLGMMPQFQQGIGQAFGAMDIANNPAVKAQLDALMAKSEADRNTLRTRTGQASQQLVQDATRQLTEQTLPALRGNAIAAGMFGSSGDDLAQGLAASRSNEAATRAVGNLAQNMQDQDAQLLAAQQAAAGGIMSNAYNTGANVFSNALGLAPRTMGSFADQGMQMIGQMPNMLQNLGQFNQNQVQQQLDAPMRRLAQYNNVMQAGAQAGQSSSAPSYSNPLGQALGLGAIGYGIYDMGRNEGWWGGSSNSQPQDMTGFVNRNPWGPEQVPAWQTPGYGGQ